jgi:hypothetical protein
MPAFLAGIALFPNSAAAQQKSTVSSKPGEGICRVYTVDAATGGAKELRASCNGRGFLLGSVSAFDVVNNKDLSAMLVDARLGDQRRILMLSVQGEQPLVENLTGQIALIAGRGPMSDLSGVDLDLSRFANAGVVGVRGQPEKGKLAKGGDVDLGQQISREREQVSLRTRQN